MSEPEVMSREYFFGFVPRKKTTGAFTEKKELFLTAWPVWITSENLVGNDNGKNETHWNSCTKEIFCLDIYFCVLLVTILNL